RRKAAKVVGIEEIDTARLAGLHDQLGMCRAARTRRQKQYASGALVLIDGAQGGFVVRREEAQERQFVVGRWSGRYLLDSHAGVRPGILDRKHHAVGHWVGAGLLRKSERGRKIADINRYLAKNTAGFRTAAIGELGGTAVEGGAAVGC